MALPGKWKPNGKRRTIYSIPLGVLASDMVCRTETERAPDSGGSPDTGNAQTIVVLNPGPQIHLDPLPNDGATRWYRDRQIRDGFTDSGWTAWVSGVPREVNRESLRLPDYPLAIIEQEQPQTEPENVRIRLRSWPDHTDAVIRYAYLALGATVPPRSESATDWTTYTAEFKLARDPSLNRKLAAWVDLNGIRAAGVQVAEIGPDLRPQITDSTTTESGASPNVHVATTYQKDAQTVAIRMYERKGNWPTKDATETGPVDPTYEKGTIDASDGWRFETGGWATSDVVYRVALPLDVNGNAGPRETNADIPYTVTATADPQITDGWFEQTQAGTACTPTTSRRKAKVHWTTAGVTDGSHDMRVYVDLDDGNGWGSLESTEVSPVTNTFYEHTFPMIEATAPAGEGVKVRFRLDLWDGAAVDDSMIVEDEDIYVATRC